MGRFFFECLGGRVIYSCKKCKTFLSNIENVISDRFRGSTGVAFLFDSVINIHLSSVEEKTMLTGRHMVRDAFCKNCAARVGWMYEFAHDPEQMYKEGKVILEKALIEESMGIDDKLALMPSSTTMTLTGLSPIFNSGSSFASSTPTNSSATSVTLANQFSRNSSTSSFESASSSPEEDRRRRNFEAGRTLRRSFRGFRGSR